MRAMAAAIVKSGLLSEEVLAEFRRWGHPVETPPLMPKDPEEIALAMEEALQEQGLVVTRETDLEAVNYYLKSQLPGVLHVTVGDGTEKQTAAIDCTFGVTPIGEYIIRWHSDFIADEMTNGETFLEFHHAGTLGAKVQVYFNMVREIFFGDTKAFMVCTPVKSNG